ncbi:hypothetical protein [Acetonema longum]|uniref:Phage protein n=1 Tax=Acetonema longum DSM 6540 TaxID=1009370 RepID=F7NK59_9FIRM|nr:hypothetical protein [Acetonema longum]EGO63500.1 hypothetical protein ALO_12361 [Acetonema longum DSM 6540]
MAKKSKLPDWMSELEELDADAASDFARENGLTGEEDDGDTGADNNQDAEDDQDADEIEESDDSDGDAADETGDDQDDDQSDEDGEEDSAEDDQPDEDSEEPDDIPAPDAGKDKGKGKVKQVPYEALHAERKKRQDLQQRLEALESRIAQQTVQQTAQQSVQQNEQQDVQQTEQQQKEQANAYVEWMEAEAEKQFKAQFGYAPNERIAARAKEAFNEKFGREPDRYDEDDGAAMDDIKADLIKRDTSRLASISTQIGQHVQSQLQSRQTEQQQRQKMNSDYMNSFKSKPDAQKIFDYANQRYAKLTDAEKAVLGPAADRVGKGQGTADDVFAFKTFMDLSEMEWRQQSGKAPEESTPGEEQKPTAQPKKKSTSQKVNELKKQPRSTMIGGKGDSSGTNRNAEADRIMQTEPYEKWPKWLKRMFEGG